MEMSNDLIAAVSLSFVDLKDLVGEGYLCKELPDGNEVYIELDDDCYIVEGDKCSLRPL
jgi:hypothetical protein